MTGFAAEDPGFEARVRSSFARQPFMLTIGATLDHVGPGTCELSMPYRRELCQQHGFLHAGVTTTLADNAAGYAAYSLMPADSSVLTIEFKINLLAPARGERFVARGAVERAGRTVTVVRSDVYAVAGGDEKPIATMLASMMCMRGMTDGVDPNTAPPG